MLDELDALMERMLALPVSDLADEAPVSMPKHRSLADQLYQEYGEETPEPEPAVIPYYRTDAVEEATQREASTIASPREVDWKLQPPPALDEIAPPSSERAPLPELDEYAAPRLSLRRLLMSPLWLINGIYDKSTAWLGPIGRWLRSPSGRGIIGFMGLALLLLASAWLACDYSGWTTWMGWNW